MFPPPMFPPTYHYPPQHLCLECCKLYPQFFYLFYLRILNGFFPLHLGHAFTIIFVLLLQDDGKELMQACADEEWELAEGLIISGSKLEARDKVIVIVFRWYMNLSTYIITIHQHYYASFMICHAGALRCD